MGTQFMQNSDILVSEEGSNYLHDNAIEKKFNQGLELDESSNCNNGCVEKKFHQFYFVKLWPCKHQDVKSQIEEAKQLVEKIKQEDLSIFEKRSQTMLNRRQVLSQLRDLNYDEDNIRQTLALITEKQDDLLEALNTTKNAHRRGENNSSPPRELISHMRHRTNNLATERKLLRKINEITQTNTVDSFSSVDKFNNMMYRPMQWQANNNVRDKKILNEIYRLELPGKEAISDAILNRKIWNPLGSRKDIKDKVGLITKTSEELRKELSKVRKGIKRVKKDLEVVEKDVDPTVGQRLYYLQLRKIQVNRHIKFELMKEQAKQDGENCRYCRYVSVLNTAKELAEKKDVKALEELSLPEVDTFMSEWNRSKEFRCNYEKSILQSLNDRKLSRDGRMRSLNEEPIILETEAHIKKSSCRDCRTRGRQCISCILDPIPIEVEGLKAKKLIMRKMPKIPSKH